MISSSRSCVARSSCCSGGIGTYVKGRGESHAEVGDRANDALRVNGSELGAQVIAEGATWH